MLGVVIVGFVCVSCGGSPKEGIIQIVDDYFTQMEQELQDVDNAADFMDFWEMASDRSDLLELIDNKYGDKAISEEDNEAVKNFISNRATAYNQTEAQKFTEFFTPVLERYEKAVEVFWTAYQSGGAIDGKRIDEAAFNAMDQEYEQAEAELMKFARYDNVPSILKDRFAEAASKYNEMFGDED